MKRSVLLTGATGFIGRHAIKPLLEAGFEVHATSRRRPEGGMDGCIFHQADLMDERQHEGLIAQVRPTHLLHFAWYAVPGKYWTSSENLGWVRASIGLLQEFARSGGKRLVIAGTCAEYDWSHEICVEGETPLAPATLYGKCKHALQEIMSEWSKQVEISSAWGRIFSLYGPHEHPDRFVSSVTSALMRGEEALCGDGSPVRDYLHVVDVATAFVAILQSDVTGAVNIASGKGVAIKDIAGKIGAKTGRPDLLRLGARKATGVEPPTLLANPRILAKTGWKPRFDLDSGLDDTIAWWGRQMSRTAANP